MWNEKRDLLVEIYLLQLFGAQQVLFKKNVYTYILSKSYRGQEGDGVSAHGLKERGWRQFSLLRKYEGVVLQSQERGYRVVF